MAYFPRRWPGIKQIGAGLTVLTAIGGLAGAGTIAMAHGNEYPSHQTSADGTTIQSLNSIKSLGSTVDANGDKDPYGVSIVPNRAAPEIMNSKIKPGDVLVSNFSDKNGTDGNGSSLEIFRNGAKVGDMVEMGHGMKGIVVTNAGHTWIVNPTSENVQVLDANGKPVVTLNNMSKGVKGLFAAPWGIAYNNNTPNPRDGAVGALFVSNLCSGSIDRIDAIPQGNKLTYKVTQIGSGFGFGSVGSFDQNGNPVLPACGTMRNPVTPIMAPYGMAWSPVSDTLFVSDHAGNRIVAYPHASTLNGDFKQGITVFKGGPLNLPMGMTINPINGDLLVVNSGDNKLIELGFNKGWQPGSDKDDDRGGNRLSVVGTKVLDTTAVNPKNGDGSALIGIAATKDAQGHLVVYFSDDNTNTLDMLSMQ